MSKRQKTRDDIKLISGCGSPAGWGSERCWYLALKCKWKQDVLANLCCRALRLTPAKTRTANEYNFTQTLQDPLQTAEEKRRGRDIEECISYAAFVVCKSGHWGRRMNLPLCLCWAQKQKWIEDRRPEDKASQHSNHHILFWFYIIEKCQSNWDFIAEAFFYVL